ncbi:MAG TPA: hypothetical protein VLA00_16815 [Xanthobacteraceae bacterium]|nr:hypothetical protein [Xanthobacteraceae bacterium]
MRSQSHRLAAACAVALGMLAAPAASANSIDEFLRRQSELCAQSGGYLTAMGCQRGSGGSAGTMPGMAPAAPPPPMNCTKHETTRQMPDGSTVTKSTETCSSF